MECRYDIEYRERDHIVPGEVDSGLLEKSESKAKESERKIEEDTPPRKSKSLNKNSKKSKAYSRDSKIEK